MDKSQNSQNLAGKMLVAMPGMGDPRFERSVVLICEHAPDTTMGLIVNKPLGELGFAELLEQLSIPTGPNTPTMGVHFGGPVENTRGFVLHSADYARPQGATLRVDGRFAMTASLEVLSDLAKGGGPQRALLALGYAGWGPGQLDQEIAANGWLTCEGDPRVVFDTPDAEKWAAALASMGVDPVTLSAAAGRA